MSEFDQGNPHESATPDRQEQIVALQQQLEAARAAESQALQDQQASGEVTEAWVNAREARMKIEQELARLKQVPGPAMKRPAPSDAEVMERLYEQTDKIIDSNTEGGTNEQ